MDPEKSIHHSSELFWIWLNKPFFVSEAIQQNPFNSEIFAWSDIGCYRDDTFQGKQWLRYPELVSKDRLLAMAWRQPKETEVTRFIKSEHDPSGDWFMGGSQMVGYIETWRRFVQSFEVVLKEYAQLRLFIGDDQLFCKQCVAENICEYVKPINT